MGNGVTPLIRNRGKTIEATLFMSSGLVTNILLDYVFVFRLRMGLAGAAIATVTAQMVVACLALFYLIKTNREVFTLHNLAISAARLKTILRIGISPFGQTLIPSVIIVLTNWQCIRYGGDDALAVFSLLSYVLASVQLRFYYGAGQKEHIRFLFKKAISLSILISLSTAVGVCLLCGQIVTLFGMSGPIAQQAMPALVITAFSFLMVGITRCISAYFYAVEQTRISSLLVYIEPCLFFPIALWTLPLFFQLDGVWAAYPVAQLALSVLCVLLYLRIEHRQTSSCCQKVSCSE